MSIQSHRLSVRYLRNFLLLVVIPVCTFAIFVNGYYNHFFLSESETRMYETVSEMVNSLDNEIKNVSILSSALVHNRDFLRTCEEYNFSTDHSEQLRLIEKLDGYFSSLFLYTNKIGSIYTFGILRYRGFCERFSRRLCWR